jgi:tetratricopeptide (TPR) repeat protein
MKIQKFLFLSMALFVPTSPSTQPRVKTEIREAIQRYYLNNHYLQAIRILERELPNSTGFDKETCLQGLARAYYDAGLFLKSLFEASLPLQIDYYRRSSTKGSTHKFGLLMSGICFFHVGNLDSARLYLERFSRATLPPGLSFWKEVGATWLGAVHHRAGRTERANEIWGSVALDNFLRTELAYVYSILKVRREEVRTLIQQVQGDQKTLRFYRNLAEAYLFLGEEDKMVDTYKKMTKLGLDNPDIREFVEKDTERKSYDPSILLTTSRICLALSRQYWSQYSGSVSEEKRRKVHSRSFEGRCSYYLGDYQKAVDILANENDPVAAIYCGAAYYRLGSKEKADLHFRQGEESKFVDVLSELGTLYAELGVRKDNAVRMCQQAVDRSSNSTSPEHRNLLRNLGFVYLQVHDYNSAAEKYGEGYVHGRANPIEMNTPRYVAEYAHALFKNNLLHRSEIIEMYSTLSREFPLAVQLYNAISLIDIIITKNREGKVILE